MTTGTAHVARAPAATAPPQRRAAPRRQWKAYLYLAPALLVLAVFLVVPAVQGAWISLYDWNGLTVATFVGARNYLDILTDENLRAGFGHAAVLILFFAGLPIVIALLLTAVMGRAVRARGLGFFRVVLFLPQVVASVVVASAFLAIYAPDGVVNQVLRALGLGGLARAWLGDFATALPAVGLVGTWVGVGLCLVLFLSGLGQIDRDLFEAARLDGAGMLREFVSIVLPRLRRHIAVALTLTVIAALKTFDLVYVTTHGGPGDATSVPAFAAYKRAFQTNHVGSACAIALTLTLIIMLITVIIQRIQPRDEPS